MAYFNARPAAGRITLLVAEMVRQLGAQRPLEQRLLELLEQAVKSLRRMMTITPSCDARA
jgi:hypothetical protein